MITAAPQSDRGQIHLQLFGPFRAVVNGSPLPRLNSRKGHWLLALLALNLNKELSREWLATRLWPDSGPSQALFNLRQCLSNLRNALGSLAPCLTAPTNQSLCLSAKLHEVYVDVAEFDMAMATNASDGWRRAVSVYSGPLLDGWNEEWISTERLTRELEYLHALEELAAYSIAHSDPASAVRYLRRTVATDPFREAAHRNLMLALAACGDHAAVVQTYQDLRTLFRESLNAGPSPETDSLYRNLQTSASSPLSTHRREGYGTPRLPTPISELVGREQDIETTANLLHKGRMVTLVGPGGVGKTRLSIATALRAAGQFENGVWFVELSPLTDARLVAHSVAHTLGLPESANQSLEERLVDRLANSNLLLILDNCEHLLDSVAQLAEKLLTSCPRIRVLATSRQALGITGEYICRVPPLSLPESSIYELDKNTLHEFGSIRLFVQRATECHATFHINSNNARDIVTVCRRLDGIPLALEMAAARLRFITIKELRIQLDDRFNSLTTGSRTALPRHKTLAALLDWSYYLLSNSEQTLLRHLSVFSGGFSGIKDRDGGQGTRDEKTAPDLPSTLNSQPSTMSSSSVIPHPSCLPSLVDKSLVVFEEREGVGRYRMLETIREYAREKLESQGETEFCRRRHRDYFLQLVAEASTNFGGPHETQSLDRIEAEHDNLRAALQFCVETPGEAEQGLRIATALEGFWRTRGYWQEGRERLAALLKLDRVQEETELYADGLRVQGVFAYDMGDYAQAKPLLEQSLSIYERLGSLKKVASALHAIASLLAIQMDFDAARSMHEESLAIRRELQDQQGIGRSLIGLAFVAFQKKEYAETIKLFDECLRVYREIGYYSGIPHVLVGSAQALASLHNWKTQVHAELLSRFQEGLALARVQADQRIIGKALFLLGSLFYYQTDYRAAQTAFLEAASVQRHLGTKFGLGQTLCNIGCVCFLTGDYAVARKSLEEALIIEDSLNDIPTTCEVLLNLGSVAYAEGKYLSARSYFREQLNTAAKIKAPGAIVRGFHGLACVEMEEGNLTRAAVIWIAAHTLKKGTHIVDEAEMQFWERRIAKAREAMGEDAFSSAGEPGKHMSIEEATVYALSLEK